jgi:hypothetical protein
MTHDLTIAATHETLTTAHEGEEAVPMIIMEAVIMTVAGISIRVATAAVTVIVTVGMVATTTVDVMMIGGIKIYRLYGTHQWTCNF